MKSNKYTVITISYLICYLLVTFLEVSIVGPKVVIDYLSGNNINMTLSIMSKVVTLLLVYSLLFKPTRNILGEIYSIEMRSKLKRIVFITTFFSLYVMLFYIIYNTVTDYKAFIILYLGFAKLLIFICTAMIFGERIIRR